MNAEVPGASTAPPDSAATEPATDATVSDQDQELTEDEKRAVEMGMERRAGYQATHPDGAHSRPKPLGGIADQILAGITPLPGNLVAAINIAEAEERRCSRRAKELPADPHAQELLESARRQLVRVRAQVEAYRAGPKRGAA